MSDKQNIEEAYADNIKRIYSVFHSSQLTAQDDADRARADKAFKDGVTFARKTRDRAIGLLPAE